MNGRALVKLENIKMGTKLLFVGLFGLLALISSSSVVAEEFENSLLADNEDGGLTVPQLITKYGYPVEVHYITTADGYILEVHRIPYGKKCGPADGKRVVWLQHGLLCDSSSYVIAGPESGLGYQMADECYDVWLGNYRGTTYGRNHTTWHPIKNREQFWAYSWNEIGLYDIPADIDYVLNVTGAEQIFWVGHSMGTTAFWVAMSERPEYNSKIRMMSAHAPVAFTEHIYSPIALLAPFANQIEWLANMIGLYEFLPSTPFMEFIGKTVCHQESLIKEICSNVLFLIGGYNSEQLDRDLLPSILGHVPAGSSVRNIVHYAQQILSKKFRKYDFGRAGNLENYGTPEPPEYDVSKVTVPVAFYWGENDALGVKSDVYRLAELLPNLTRKFRVNHDRYNHLDFLWAKDNNDLLNRQTIEFMKNF